MCLYVSWMLIELMIIIIIIPNKKKTRCLTISVWYSSSSLESVISAGLVGPSHLPGRSEKLWDPDRDGAQRMIYADLAIIIHTEIINGIING